jgi:hypothetical protein
MSAGEDARSGRHSKSTNNDHVERVCAVIRGNRRLTVRKAADEVDISIGSCHQILLKKIQILRFSERFAPRFLTDDQKQNRVEISQEPPHPPYSLD